MRSTPVGDPESVFEEAGSARRADSRGVVLAVVVLGLLAAAVWLDLGYYAPRGALSGGTAVVAERDSQMGRNRAVVKIVPEMALHPGVRPTLADAIRFFGLEEETLGCSAQATAGEEEVDERRLESMERQPRALGDSVTLCLD
ncbi:MAG: hypothetical protein ABJC13_09655 [Acidobacteriota bacterium]